MDPKEYEARVECYIEQGMSRSDAQALVEAEELIEIIDADPQYTYDTDVDELKEWEDFDPYC
jgi:hypothetical protein